MYKMKRWEKLQQSVNPVSQVPIKMGTGCKLARFFSPKISKTSVFNRQAGRQATIVPYNVPEKRVVRK